MATCGADALDLDYQTDVRLAHELMKNSMVFIGNLDPSAVVTFGTPERVEAKSRKLIRLFADTGRFIQRGLCDTGDSATGEHPGDGAGGGELVGGAGPHRCSSKAQSLESGALGEVQLGPSMTPMGTTLPVDAPNHSARYRPGRNLTVTVPPFGRYIA